MTTSQIPATFRVVTKKEFFAALYADPRDIMPSTANPLFTNWETKTRAVWGWASTGWKNSGENTVWALAPTASASAS